MNPRIEGPGQNGRVAAADADLVTRALGGQQDACRQLVERHSRSVFNLIVRMVRDQGVAEELAQDAFVKAFGALKGFDPSYKFSSWILRIAHNTAIDYLRRLKLPTVSIDVPTPGRDLRDLLIDQRQPTPFDHAEGADLARDLEQAMAQLRPEYRRLIVLRYQEDQAYEEMAETVGLPLGTVKSHLHRARQELARLMTEAGWGPESAPETGAVQPSGGSGS
jgi:RNA polymerase sigma-70 factor (ECF subfamily)